MKNALQAPAGCVRSHDGRLARAAETPKKKTRSAAEPAPGTLGHSVFFCFFGLGVVRRPRSADWATRQSARGVVPRPSASARRPPPRAAPPARGPPERERRSRGAHAAAAPIDCRGSSRCTVTPSPFRRAPPRQRKSVGNVTAPAGRG